MLDGDKLWLVRQPREAVGSPDLLEIPAWQVDEEGEEPLETAKRELAEEIGKRAIWTPLGPSTRRPASPTRWSTSSSRPGSTTSKSAPRCTRTSGSTSRCARWPDLDALIEENRDSKTIIGLARLRERLSRR